MVNELYKNIIQRLPAAIALVTFIFGILYLQNIFVILALLMGIGILLIKEWLTLSGSKIDLKQIIFFVTLIMLSVYFADEFIDLFLALTAIFWITYEAGGDRCHRFKDNAAPAGRGRSGAACAGAEPDHPAC